MGGSDRALKLKQNGMIMSWTGANLTGDSSVGTTSLSGSSNLGLDRLTKEKMLSSIAQTVTLTVNLCAL